mgnify:CR=1 FL=1
MAASASLFLKAKNQKTLLTKQECIKNAWENFFSPGIQIPLKTYNLDASLHDQKKFVP